MKRNLIFYIMMILLMMQSLNCRKKAQEPTGVKETEPATKSEQKLEKKPTEGEKFTKSIEDLFNELKKQERNLRAREETLQRITEELNARNAEITKKEQELRNKEIALLEKEKQLLEKEKTLNQKARSFRLHQVVAYGVFILGLALIVLSFARFTRKSGSSAEKEPIKSEDQVKKTQTKAKTDDSKTGEKKESESKDSDKETN